MSELQQPPNPTALKRKRSSPSLSAAPLPPQKAPRTVPNALQINYLARQSNQDLPLLNKNEAIPDILDVLSAYSSVLDRHESLASNLGARPLGPILIKRFEKCFDNPPDIIASHSHTKDSANDTALVTWLEVVQFAQSHPGQFNLSTFSEGRRVCQFYYPHKQVRVQVSEEDYLFIKSGRCQDLIPPLPIWEDEEKEVGTCEILERQLRELTNAADTVAARTRQLSHRLKGRRMAIQERRAAEGIGEGQMESMHKASPDHALHRDSPLAGVAANHTNGQMPTPTYSGHEQVGPNNNIRAELMQHFHAMPRNQNNHDAGHSQGPASEPIPRRSIIVSSSGQSIAGSGARSGQREDTAHADQHGTTNSSTVSQAAAAQTDPLQYYLAENDASSIAPRQISSSHSLANSNNGILINSNNKHNFSRPLAPNQEMSQPFRAACQAHMESLSRGARVMPPCDRCRRLKMDCLKNLTSCQGCTKKHARCHWKDVDRSEVDNLEQFFVEGFIPEHGTGSARGTDDSEGGSPTTAEDLEALHRENTVQRHHAEIYRPADTDKARDVQHHHSHADQHDAQRHAAPKTQWAQHAAASAYASHPGSGTVSPKDHTTAALNPSTAATPTAASLASFRPASSIAHAESSHGRQLHPIAAGFTAVNNAHPSPTPSAAAHQTSMPPMQDRPLSPFSSVTRPSSVAQANMSNVLPPISSFAGSPPPPQPSQHQAQMQQSNTTPPHQQRIADDSASKAGAGNTTANGATGVDSPAPSPTGGRPFPLPSSGVQGVRIGGASAGSGSVGGWRAM